MPRRRKSPVRVRSIAGDSFLFAAGLRKGDEILEVNGEIVEDALEFGFLTACESICIEVDRRGVRHTLSAERTPGAFTGVEFYPLPLRRCGNRCVFCFVDQLPGGMRKSLYIKDEDLRHSFMNGNYVTLSNAEPDELERMGEMGLSPLFISVHATNTTVRNRLLGNRHAPDILDQLEFGIDCGICFHTQIVVCPGINDGKLLEQSIRELLALGENILSIAVVPVGLTRHRKTPLTPVNSSSAREIIELVDRLGELDKSTLGRRRVFSADELYLRANLAIPPSTYYEDFPQIENGVGLIRTARMEWERLRRRQMNSSRVTGVGEKRRVLLLTGVSAAPFLGRLSASIQKTMPNLNISVHTVVNRFFGNTVTVAGLLTASDMMHASKQYGKSFDLMVIPGEALNYRGVTLDGYSLERMNRIVGKRVVAPRSIEEMVRCFCE